MQTLVTERESMVSKANALQRELRLREQIREDDWLLPRAQPYLTDSEATSMSEMRFTVRAGKAALKDVV
ncbi:hypothetical protein CDL15_Pgr008508 [Punica granatum]|uniref:Uncharacterized protein n=1 Tax=Punica granatum TaxID=22663 RepID=A0A218WN29_PUNGR|nr:hypothetical protein CDL15_Pgr008508 [Punica granatum]